MYTHSSPFKKSNCKIHSEVTEDVSSKLGLIISLNELQSQINGILKLIFPEMKLGQLMQLSEIQQTSRIKSAVTSGKITALSLSEISEEISKFESNGNIKEFESSSKEIVGIIIPFLSSTAAKNCGFFCVLLHPAVKDLDSLKEKFNFIDKQVSVTLTRLSKIENLRSNNFPSATSNKILDLCASLFDQDAGELQKKVLSYLIRNTQSETGFLLLVCSDTKELLCQICGQIIEEDPISFDAEENGLFSSILQTKATIKLDKFNEKQLNEVLEAIKTSGMVIKPRNAIAVPVLHQENKEVIAIVCLINKLSSEAQFSDLDEEVIKECFKFTTSVLFTTIAYQRERRLKFQTEKMLTVAKNIFSRMDNLNDLLLMIMKEARHLTQAEKCSVFLVDEDSNELVAKVFDGLPTTSDKHEVKLEDGTIISPPVEIRIPKSQGIAGHVATTGKMLNIKNAYEHPLFYRGVDNETGFKTRNILCFPIQNDRGSIVGVAQLCNKLKGGHCFTKMDEEVARAFAIYCCISITHSLMYKKVEDAQHRSRLANELMMFHMKISDDEMQLLSCCEIPPVTKFLTDYESFSSIPRNVQDSDSVMASVSMFDRLNFISRWRINRKTLVKFLFMVKRNYRDPPYHNWMHAFSVAHFVYICIRNLSNQLEAQLTEMELFALFVSSICHDVDHRGTNNSFQVQSGSVLAALYSSEGSVLERHHFSQTVCILNTDGCNLFESLPGPDYMQILDLIRDIILATDLAHHLRIFDKLRALPAIYDSSNSEHHRLLLCLLMTSADLSDQTKNWRNTRSVAELIYKEFFRQGDLEKAIGNQPCEQMDRERAVVPNLQIAFLDGIVSPLYGVLSQFYPSAQCINETIKRNRENWSKISEMVTSNTIKGNSEEIFRNQLVEDDYD